MTLVIFKQGKNGKRDTREIDFDRDMKRITLQRTSAEKELGALKGDVLEATKLRDQVKKDIAIGQKNLFDIREEISLAIKDGGQNITDLREREREAAGGAKDKKIELEKLENYLISLSSEIDSMILDINILDEKISDLRDQVDKSKHELVNAQGQLATTLLAVAEAEKKLESINDGIAESEEFVVSLNEREKFLARKEADLGVYEKRLKKFRIDAGIKTDMVFK